MNKPSMENIIRSVITLHTHDLRKAAIRKIAKAQGPNDQEENALWCDFYDCLQELTKEISGIDVPDLNQDMIEEAK